MTSRPRVRPLLLAALVAVGAAAASASIDVQLRGKDKVSGTIGPGSWEADFQCDIPLGATLSASAKGKSKAGPVVKLALRGSGGGDVAGTKFVTKGLGTTLSPFAAPASDSYQLAVFGDGNKDGDYDLTVTWTPKSTWTGAGGPTNPMSSDTFAFSAPAGATATIDVLKAKGSTFAASLVSVIGPSGFSRDLTAKGGPHAVVAALPAMGDYLVSFTNAGLSAGGWTAKVKLKLPKTTSGKFDLRSLKLDAMHTGDPTVYGRIVGPGGGVVLPPIGTGSPLEGSSVTIPASTLGGPVVVTIATAPSIAPDGAHGAGEAINFGPTGTTFDPTGSDPTKQATITIPFDPNYFPGGDTSTMVIYVKSGNGATTAVPRPYLFNGDTVTFSASHFSTYQPTTVNPRPFEGQFLVLEVSGHAQSAFGADFGFDVHSMDSDGSRATLFKSDTSVSWFDLAASGAFANLNNGGASSTLPVQVVNDRLVQLTDNSGQSPQTLGFARGDSDDVFIGQGIPVVLLRRAAAESTQNSLAGSWHLVHMQFEADPQNQTQTPALSFQVKGDSAEMTISGDGKVIVGPSTGSESDSLFPTGQWTTKPRSKPAQNDLTIFAGDGVIFLNLPDGSQVSLKSVVNGDVLVGRMSATGSQVGNGPGPSVELILMVRAAANTPKSAFAGRFPWTGSEIDVVDAKLGGDQDFAFVVPTATATISSGGVLSLSGTFVTQTHSGSGNALGIGATPIPSSTGGKLSLKADGSFTAAGGTYGALSSRGALLLTSRFGAGQFEIDFATLDSFTQSRERR